MKKLIVLLIVILSLPYSLSADEITDYKVNFIKHPANGNKNSEPLIIDYQVVMNKTNLDHRKIECKPLYYNQYNIRNGKEYLDNKESFLIGYDAFIRPDKKGFLLYKYQICYGQRTISEMVIYDLSIDKAISLEPNGTNLFFTKDNNNLIAVEYIESQRHWPEIDSCVLYYYSFVKYNSQPTHIKTISYKEFMGLPLIECKE